MGNDNSKVNVDLGWTATELSNYILGMNDEQISELFENNKKIDTSKLGDVLEQCVFQFLKFKNIRKLPNVKSSKINSTVDEFHSHPETVRRIRDQLQKIEKWLLETKLDQVKYVSCSDFSSKVGPWLEEFDKTMDTL